MHDALKLELREREDSDGPRITAGRKLTSVLSRERADGERADRAVVVLVGDEV